MRRALLAPKPENLKGDFPPSQNQIDQPPGDTLQSRRTVHVESSRQIRMGISSPARLFEVVFAEVIRLKMVGERGFEPPTPWSRTRCSTRLSHSPNFLAGRLLHGFLAVPALRKLF